jgi:hypothetical protein
VDLGRTADAEGTELGVERELPLVRSLLARALLARGDLDEAHDRARAAVEAARTLGYPSPLANALETLAMVGVAAGAEPASVAALVATASAIRAEGDRPVPAPLSEQVEAFRSTLPPAEPLSPEDAAATALELG